jgi:hypothetical protein
MIPYLAPILILVIGYSLTYAMARSLGLVITWRHLLASIAVGAAIVGSAFAIMSA